MNIKLGIKNHRTFIIQALRFIFVGVLNTGVDVAVYYVLTRYTGYFNHHIFITRILSFLSGSICSFALNRLWTFQKRDAVSSIEVFKFYVTIGMSLVIGLVSMRLFVNIFHFYDLIALGLSIIFTFIWNFTISRLWVFKSVMPGV
ncbi:MAG: GtrA family protein [Candidatus Nomurabacteria bacterium]|nr:GtrA family protein [Candidatus Nomurabacteria bacterium]